MKKNIKEYLHLYLGCEVMGILLDEPRKGYLTGIHGEYGAEIQFFNEDGVNVSEEPEYNEYQQVKPILRPLSDMTEEEAFWLCDYFGGYGDLPGQRKYETYQSAFDKMVVSWGTTMREKWIPADCEVWKPEQTKYLLSKSFDLFDFIKEGLAIDKTKTELTN